MRRRHRLRWNRRSLGGAGGHGFRHPTANGSGGLLGGSGDRRRRARPVALVPSRKLPPSISRSTNRSPTTAPTPSVSWTSTVATGRCPRGRGPPPWQRLPHGNGHPAKGRSTCLSTAACILWCTGARWSAVHGALLLSAGRHGTKARLRPKAGWPGLARRARTGGRHCRAIWLSEIVRRSSVSWRLRRVIGCPTRWAWTNSLLHSHHRWIPVRRSAAPAVWKQTAQQGYAQRL